MQFLQQQSALVDHWKEHKQGGNYASWFQDWHVAAMDGSADKARGVMGGRGCPLSSLHGNATPHDDSHTSGLPCLLAAAQGRGAVAAAPSSPGHRVSGRFHRLTVSS